MRGFGDIAERLRRSTVQIFNGADRSPGLRHRLDRPADSS